ncbi:hypothetical protein [Hyalangium sp.]|uniref:hypothetical protein n=1 Tax=Hyalangium sp. TaxID=2028555 RepID=UPI002D55AF34|nr:hypothetical protein [Hyalangium sp.]HYH97409.1 hypothetical protein [Hyalangium sp.]
MGAVGKAIGKVLKVAAPILGAINPLFGAAASFAGGLLSGEKPLQALLGAAGNLIPGGGLAKGLLGKFAGAAGGGILDGLGGNSLFSGLLGAAGGKGGVTDLVGDLVKNVAKKGAEKLTTLGQNNAVELSAQRMAQLMFR